MQLRPRLIPRGWAMSRPTPRTRFPPRPTLGARPRLVQPQGVGSDSSGPTGSAPPHPTPEGRIPSRPAPGRDFCLARSLGVGFATGQKQWPQGRTRTASTTTAWRRTPGSTSRARPNATGGRIRPCWETHIAHRVNRVALCCQLPARPPSNVSQPASVD